MAMSSDEICSWMSLYALLLRPSFQRLLHLVISLLDHRKTLQRIVFQLQQVGIGYCGDIVIFRRSPRSVPVPAIHRRYLR